MSARVARKPPPPPPVRLEKQTLLDWAAGAPLLGGVLLIPLVLAGGLDAFRLPKELLFIGEATLAAAALVIHLLYGAGELRRRAAAVRPELLLAGAAVLWTALATLTSTNRAISIDSLRWVAAGATIFAATALTAQAWNAGTAAAAVLAAAAVNSGVALLQRFEVWSPVVFTRALPLRTRVTALLGNPDDVGAYLVAPLLLAAALALASPRRWRIGLVAVAAFLAAGLFATATLTAIAAVAAGLMAMFHLRWRSAARAILAVAFGAAVLVFAILPPLRHRVTTFVAAVRAGDLYLVSSGRLSPTLVALDLFRDHPIAGAGPGTYHWWYMPLKVKINQSHPELIDRDTDNYGQAHNDHLELLAAAGIPAYALFLAALARLGSYSLRGRDEGEPESFRGTVTRLLALPLSVAVFVLTLAQFPLELAAVLVTLLHLGGVSAAWSRR